MTRFVRQFLFSHSVCVCVYFFFRTELDLCDNVLAIYCIVLFFKYALSSIFSLFFSLALSLPAAYLRRVFI